jgi:hypothetical protein
MAYPNIFETIFVRLKIWRIHSLAVEDKNLLPPDRKPTLVAEMSLRERCEKMPLLELKGADPRQFSFPYTQCRRTSRGLL